MRTAIVMSGIALALTLETPAAAQMIEAGVVVRSGPVSGHVVIADPGPVYHRTVVVERYAPRVIVVTHVYPHGRGRGWWKRQGYRPVVLYYDVRRDRFYDRRHRDGRGIREIVVYERGGRYYSDYEWRRDRRDDRDYRYRDREWDDLNGRE
jgi:hypothetical protein